MGFGRDMTAEAWQPVEKQYTMAKVRGMKIPIEWDYGTATYTFKVCFYGVDRFLDVGEVNVGWIFGKKTTIQNPIWL